MTEEEKRASSNAICVGVSVHMQRWGMRASFARKCGLQTPETEPTNTLRCINSQLLLEATALCVCGHSLQTPPLRLVRMPRHRNSAHYGWPA